MLAVQQQQQQVVASDLATPCMVQAAQCFMPWHTAHQQAM
jgi:hypothetical protein